MSDQLYMNILYINSSTPLSVSYSIGGKKRRRALTTGRVECVADTIVLNIADNMLVYDTIDKPPYGDDL